ncbi:MAG TPA: hypothetical protein VGX78_07725 [Pirellulales bacterium]|jgi:PIN domain nuclease of toxin-antitoxin system|nr:hypothetical protein [Pirellulales bacterium]
MHPLRRAKKTLPALPTLTYLPKEHVVRSSGFARLLAATALVEGLTLVSADPAFDAYGVTRLW